MPFEQVNPEVGLYLSNNRLTRAPGALFNLQHLTYLSLRNNKISELPPSISNLQNLRELNLSLNRLRYLPGELLNLLKFPSVLSSLHIHPNPFYRPQSRIPPRPEAGSVIHDGSGDDLVPAGYIRLFEDDTVLISPDNRSIEEVRERLSTVEIPYPWHAWQVLLLARSPVQYCDSRGSVLSRFRLPYKIPDDYAQSIDPKEEQHVTIETESVSALSVPHLPGRAFGVPPKPSRVLSLFELALKSASRAAQTVSQSRSHFRLAFGTSRFLARHCVSEACRIPVDHTMIKLKSND